jgi:hypothetical protein
MTCVMHIIIGKGLLLWHPWLSWPCFHQYHGKLKSYWKEIKLNSTCLKIQMDGYLNCFLSLEFK